MPQLIHPGRDGPETADVLYGSLVVYEGISASVRGVQGAAVNMPGLMGIPGEFADVEEAISVAKFISEGALRGAAHLVSYEPTVYKAVAAALIEAARMGYDVHRVEVHSWFAKFAPGLFGATPAEIRALAPDLVWMGLADED